MALEKLLDLTVGKNDFLTGLSIEDSKKFEFVPEKEIIGINTENAANVLMAYLKAHKECTKLDLSIFKNISKEA